MYTMHFVLSCSPRLQAAEVNFFLLHNDFTFFQPQSELVLKLFLIFGQSDLIVLI